MEYVKFDLVSKELNPTVLFAGKIERTEGENDYHTHDFPEIGIIMEGKGTYHLNGEYVPVEAGDVMIFNPGVGHESMIYQPEEKRTEFFVGFTDVEFIGMRPNHIELKNGGNILHTKGKTWRTIYHICEEMEKENLARTPGRYIMLKSFLVQLLLHIVREEMEPEAPVEGRKFGYGGKQDIAEQIADYLDEHYAEKISLDQIAENMYLSPYYISKLFKAEIGQSPIQYLIQVRMEKAKELLEQGTSFSIAEIAEMVGYDDVYHFSKLFKKAYGISPSKVRKNVNASLGMRTSRKGN